MPSRVSNAGMTGELKAYAGGAIPTGFLPCDGSALSRTTFANLFNALGGTGSPFGLALDTHPAGTHFNIPDSRGRSWMGDGTGPSLSARNLGEKVGAETHTLSYAQMPQHTHAGYVFGGVGSYGGAFASGGHQIFGQSYEGSSAAHNNVQPSLVVKALIKY